MSGVSVPRHTPPSTLSYFLFLSHTQNESAGPALKQTLVYSRKRRKDGEKGRRRDGESLGAGLCPGSPSLSGSLPSATAAAWL